MICALTSSSLAETEAEIYIFPSFSSRPSYSRPEVVHRGFNEPGVTATRSLAMNFFRKRSDGGDGVTIAAAKAAPRPLLALNEIKLQMREELRYNRERKRTRAYGGIARNEVVFYFVDETKLVRWDGVSTPPRIEDATPVERVT